MKEDLDAENHEVYDVVFTYTVNGKRYAGTFEDLPDAYKAGDEIAVFYNPENPNAITNGRLSGLIAPIMIGVGVLALVFGVFRTVKAFRKSKELDQVPRASTAAFEGFKQTPGVTEYYCRYDGATLKPGYILEDAARKVLFEGKMTKQAMIGASTYSFIDHTAGRTVDLFSEASHPDYRGITEEQYENRMLLRRVMLRNGFAPIDCEWWHFALKNEPYPDTYFNFPVSSEKPGGTD